MPKLEMKPIYGIYYNDRQIGNCLSAKEAEDTVKNFTELWKDGYDKGFEDAIKQVKGE